SSFFRNCSLVVSVGTWRFSFLIFRKRVMASVKAASALQSSGYPWKGSALKGFSLFPPSGDSFLKFSSPPVGGSLMVPIDGSLTYRGSRSGTGGVPLRDGGGPAPGRGRGSRSGTGVLVISRIRSTSRW